MAEITGHNIRLQPQHPVALSIRLSAQLQSLLLEAHKNGTSVKFRAEDAPGGAVKVCVGVQCTTCSLFVACRGTDTLAVSHRESSLLPAASTALEGTLLSIRRHFGSQTMRMWSKGLWLLLSPISSTSRSV